MARKSEYKSTGGAFGLNDALKSIDDLIDDVKRADEQDETSADDRRSSRATIAELQDIYRDCSSELLSSWKDLGLDPLYMYTNEEVDKEEYTKTYKFLHPLYKHVWLTEGSGMDIGEELIPFITFKMVFNYADNAVKVLCIKLDAKLNLPEFKTSRKAASVDLEILREDAKKVEMVANNGAHALEKLTSTITDYCNENSIEINIEEDVIESIETEDERIARLAEEARIAEEERLAEDARIAEEKRLEEEAEEDRLAAEESAEKEAKAAEAKEEKERKKAEREQARKEKRAKREKKSGSSKKPPAAKKPESKESAGRPSVPKVPKVPSVPGSGAPAPPPLPAGRASTPPPIPGGGKKANNPIY